MGDFRMPSLGADMDVGTIVEWLVKPGDPVTRGQIVAVVDTAKAAIEIEAFESGVVEEILVGTGTQVPVGTPLAVIGAGARAEPSLVETAVAALPTPGLGSPSAEGPGLPRATPPVRHLAHQLGVDLGSVAGTGPDGHVTHDDVLAAAAAVPGGAHPEPAAEPLAAVAPAPGAAAIPPGSRAPTVPAEASGTGQQAQPPGPRPGAPVAAARLRVTPRARRLAAERGIDLESVAGSGHEGAVLGADVQRAVVRAAKAREPAAVEPAAAPQAGESAPGRPLPAAAQPERKAAMRTAIATLMSRSNTEIPHYYVTRMLDMAGPLDWLRGHNAGLPPARRLLPAALFLRATVLAAIAVPDLNGHWVDGTLRRADRVDLGVAVATRGGGLVTPAIPDAGPFGVDELMAALGDLVRRARRGTLRQAEMAGASITVSNLGETGPDALYGVIFPPQVALVGVGGIVERPWAIDGMLTVRPIATVVVAADHRASDGRTASAFLAAFAHALDHPEEM